MSNSSLTELPNLQNLFFFLFLKLKNLVVMHLESFLVLFKAPLFFFLSFSLS